MFKLECGLQFRVAINPVTMQSLRLKVSSLPTTGTGMLMVTMTGI